MLRITKTIFLVAFSLILGGAGCAVENRETVNEPLLSGVKAEEGEMPKSVLSDITNFDLTDYERFVSDLSAGKQTNSTTFAVQFFGDMMLDRNVAVKMGKKGIDYLFEKVKPSEKYLFGGADILIANLEGAFAEKRIDTSKKYAFRFDPKLAPALKSYGFSAFDMANNHSYDMGSKNVIFTREVLKNNGINYFGDELREGHEYLWVNKDVPGGVAFIGLHNTYHTPNRDVVKKMIAKGKSEADYVVVNVHWGVEYSSTSTQKQREMARWLIDEGVDAVVGHHPHVIEEVEIYKEKPVFYSLGNFIFDQYFSRETQEGLSAALIFQDGKIKSVYLFPFKSVSSQIQIMNEEERDVFFAWLKNASRLGEKKLESGIIEI